MPTTVKFKVAGFRELYATLDHLPDLAKRKGLEPLLIESLIPMRDTARHLAPDDPSTSPPWDLKTSIEIGTRQSQSPAHEKLSEARAFMGPTRFGYPQAIMQEFGTVKMVATPYMRPAYGADKGKVIEIISKGFARQVEATLRKYGSRKMI